MTRRRIDWTMAETMFATRLHAAGYGPAAIALAMPRRSAAAIKERLQRIGMWKAPVVDDPYVMDLRGKLRRLDPPSGPRPSMAWAAD